MNSNDSKEQREQHCVVTLYCENTTLTQVTPQHHIQAAKRNDTQMQEKSGCILREEKNIEKRASKVKATWQSSSFELVFGTLVMALTHLSTCTYG